MAFIPTDDGASLVLVWTRGTDRWTNTMWLSKPDFTQTDMQDLADLVAGGGIGGFAVYLGGDVDLAEVLVYDMRVQNGGFAQAIPSNVGGGASSQTLPLGVAIVSTFNTAKRGRSFRGRNYWSGVPEEHWDGLQFSNTITSALDGFLEGLQAAAALDGWTLGVRSAIQNGVPLALALIEPVTTISVRSPRAGSQRRRNQRP